MTYELHMHTTAYTHPWQYGPVILDLHTLDLTILVVHISIFPGHYWTCLYSSIQRVLHEIERVLLRCTLLRVYNCEHNLAIHHQLSL